MYGGGTIICLLVLFTYHLSTVSTTSDSVPNSLSVPVCGWMKLSSILPSDT